MEGSEDLRVEVWEIYYTLKALGTSSYVQDVDVIFSFLSIKDFVLDMSYFLSKGRDHMIIRCVLDGLYDETLFVLRFIKEFLIDFIMKSFKFCTTFHIM